MKLSLARKQYGLKSSTDRPSERHTAAFNRCRALSRRQVVYIKKRCARQIADAVGAVRRKVLIQANHVTDDRQTSNYSRVAASKSQYLIELSTIIPLICKVKLIARAINQYGYPIDRRNTYSGSIGYYFSI